jgi:hypothetical protein
MSKFFLYYGLFLPSWIRIRIPNWDFESGYGSNDQIGSGSETLIIVLIDCTDRFQRLIVLRRLRWRSSAAPPAPAIHSPPLLPLPSQLRRRHPIFWTCSVNISALLDFRNRQCCGYPESRIQKQRQKLKIILFLNRFRKCFLPKAKLSKIRVWDPRSGLRKKPIPAPGVKKAPDPQHF